MELFIDGRVVNRVQQLKHTKYEERLCVFFSARHVPRSKYTLGRRDTRTRSGREAHRFALTAHKPRREGFGDGSGGVNLPEFSLCSALDDRVEVAVNANLMEPPHIFEATSAPAPARHAEMTILPRARVRFLDPSHTVCQASQRRERWSLVIHMWFGTDRHQRRGVKRGALAP